MVQGTVGMGGGGVSDTINIQAVERALKYMADTDEEAAKAKALVKALEHSFKTIVATEFMKATGAQGEREKIAHASPAYREHNEKYQNAVADYELLANKRKRAELTIEVWRSLNANQRRGNV